MTGQADSPPAPDPELIGNLQLRVREMLPHRPGRWAWDLRDGRDHSWFESMFEFDSAERAKNSGLARLDELRRSLNAPPVDARRGDAKNARLVIVSADDAELFATLKQLLGNGQRIEIIPERRKALTPMGRRTIDRRRACVNSAAKARGWWVVPHSEETA